MTFGEKILSSISCVLAFYGTTLITEVVRSTSAQESITVKGTPIELPTGSERWGSTYTVYNDCLHEHPEDAAEACWQVEKAVIRIGDSLGSVVLDTGEVIMVKGERGDFSFISDAIQEAPR